MRARAESAGAHSIVAEPKQKASPAADFSNHSYLRCACLRETWIRGLTAGGKALECTRRDAVKTGTSPCYVRGDSLRVRTSHPAVGLLCLRSFCGGLVRVSAWRDTDASFEHAREVGGVREPARLRHGVEGFMALAAEQEQALRRPDSQIDEVFPRGLARFRTE